jgi:predicted CXXCH cytochrome family protein
MKRTFLGVIVALVIMAGAYGISWGVSGGSGPHTDYRSGYSSCSGSPACHTISKGTFIPEQLDLSHLRNFSNFCLTCHNASGEAHDKSVGSPSTNAYVNGTGFDQSGSYKGNSHSWKGNNGNAGTVTPGSAFFNRTTYMYNNKVVICETCHVAALKSRTDDIDWAPATDLTSDQIHYTFGSSNSKQYLSQYIKVYRWNTSVARPTGDTRSKKKYLVSPSEYTYNPANATVTFNQQQGATGTVFIYVDIPQPYLRVDNTGNAICLDCHSNRADSQVSHAPGTGAKDQHPVAVTYGHGNGLNDTMKPAVNGSVYLEGNQVLCTSCHDPHNAASNKGELLRNADDSALCGNCHKTMLDGYSTAGSVNNHNGTKVCLDCHTTHGSNNILLIRNVINGTRVNFQNFTGTTSGFANAAGTGVCQVCHSATSHYTSDGSGTDHNTGLKCIDCHGHNTGFKPNGDCSSCHGFPPGTGTPVKYGPNGWTPPTNGDEHASHMTHLAAAPFFLTGQDACKRCHGGTIPRTDHNKGKATAGIDFSAGGSGTFNDGGTAGMTKTWDDSCTNVSCHTPSTGTRYWTTPTGCNGCHGFPPATNAHMVQYANGIRSHLVSSGDAIYSAITAYGQAGWPCGKCHNNALNKHRNGTTDVAPGGGYGACGGEFTINVNTHGSDITCSNVVCHTANKTTPNWY